MVMQRPKAETRSSRKRKAIIEAATDIFLENGYDGTSMDDLASRAAVSKPTVYKHFLDKSQLYAEIVRSTTDQIDELVSMVAATTPNTESTEDALAALARKLLGAVMQPRVLRLRRMVIANADRFPEIASSWYEQGFGRVLATLAAYFKNLADQGTLQVADPLIAANHFAGLLFWIPMNKAMFGIADSDTNRAAEVEWHATMAVRAFLNGYGRPE